MAPKRFQNTANTVKQVQTVGLVGGDYIHNYV